MAEKRDIKRRSNFAFIKGTTPPPKFNHLLVIGIDQYSNGIPPLNNAVLDAKTFQKVMEEKYSIKNTISLFDEEATSENIINAFDQLRENLTKKDNLVLYYSGHGELHSNRGYWLPIDAIAGKRHTYFPNHYVKDLLKDLKAFHVIVIIDACFSGSLLAKVRSSKANRYYNMSSRWVMTSGQVEPVLDGDPGENSPFAKSLITQLKHAKKQHLSLSELWVNMREGIVTNSKQTPACEPVRDVNHMGGEYYFIDQNISEEVAAAKDISEGSAVKIVNKIPRWLLILIPVLLIATIAGSIFYNKATKVQSREITIEFPQIATPYYKNLLVKENKTIGDLKKMIWDQLILAQNAGNIKGQVQLENGITEARLFINRKPNNSASTKTLKEANINPKDTITIKEFEGLIDWANEDDFWNSIKDDGSLDSFNKYLEEYPNGRHKEEALAKTKQLEEEAAWTSAQTGNTVVSFQTYIDAYPESIYKATALVKMEELTWQAALNGNKKELFEDYIAKYPDGKYLPTANSKITDLNKKAAEDLVKEKEKRKRFGLLASFNLTKPSKPGFDEVSGKNVRVEVSNCFKSPINTYESGKNGTEINFWDWSGCSQEEPGTIIAPHLPFSESFSFCAWVHPEQRSSLNRGWIVGQSGKRPDLGDSWARLFIGTDESGGKYYGRGDKMSFLIPHSKTPLHLMAPNKVKKRQVGLFRC